MATTVLAAPVAAVEWVTRPYLMAMQTYSDNITLAPDNPSAIPGARPRQPGYVTTIAPGISVQHRGPWSLSMFYRMQNLIYAGATSGVNLYNQFQFQTSGDIIKHTLSAGAYANAGQANIGTYGPNSIYAVSPINRTGNTTNFSTATLFSTWRPHFSGYADGVVGLTYSHVGTGQGNYAAPTYRPLQSDILSQYANIYSGQQFELVQWRGNLYNTNYLGANDSPSQSYSYPAFLNYNGQVQYRLSEKVQPFVQGGAFNNSAANVSSNYTSQYLRNGPYWNAGLIWTPSRRLFFQAGGGMSYPSNSNPTPTYFVSFRSTPSKRSEITAIFRESGVGGAYGAGGYGGFASGAGGATGYGSGVGVFGGGSALPSYGGGGGGAGMGSGIANPDGIYKQGMSGACSQRPQAGMTAMTSVLGGATGGMGMGMGGMGMGMGMGMGGGMGGFGGGMMSAGLGGTPLGINGVNQLGGFNAGTTVNAGVCHRTRRTYWQGVYTEYVTTAAQALASQSTFNTNSFGGGYGNPYYMAINQPNLVSAANTIVRKGGQASVSYMYSRNTWTLTGYQENRSYEESGKQDLVGLYANWVWQFNTKMSSFLSFAWQNTNNNFTGQPQYNTDFTLAQVGLFRRFYQNVSGGINYQYTTQSSDSALSAFSQNQVFLSLFMSF